MPYLSPQTLTIDEQKLVLRVTAKHPRDHTIISFALGTGLFGHESRQQQTHHTHTHVHHSQNARGVPSHVTNQGQKCRVVVPANCRECEEKTGKNNNFFQTSWLDDIYVMEFSW